MSKESRINEQIHVPEVRLVGANNEQLGVVSIHDALQRARALDLDLVEVAPAAAPPVCRIMDYGKFKYTQSKREQEARKKQTVIQVKEIKVRPKTDEHDLNVKIKHIRRFLEDGDKVKVTVRFRGRELTYASQSGFEVLKHVLDAVGDVSKIETSPKMEGKTMMMIVSPSGQKKKTAGTQAVVSGQRPASVGGSTKKPQDLPGPAEKQEGK